MHVMSRAAGVSAVAAVATSFQERIRFTNYCSTSVATKNWAIAYRSFSRFGSICYPLVVYEYLSRYVVSFVNMFFLLMMWCFCTVIEIDLEHNSWLCSVVISMFELWSRGRWLHSRTGDYQLVAAWIGECPWTGKPSQYIINTKVNSALNSSGVGKLSANQSGT